MTSSALQGLLRKLGAGLDDLVPNASMAHSRLKHILQGLRAEGEEGRQIEALTNLVRQLRGHPQRRWLWRGVRLVAACGR